MPRQAKMWRLLPHDPAAIESLARAIHHPPIVAQLLLNRKLDQPEQAKRFLTAPLAGLYEPEMLPGVIAAAGRIWQALERKERIVVYGDYDVDGVTATAILLHLFQLLGAPVQYHVPHRLDDGYGLNAEALGRIAQEGAQVVITVDCGITGVVEADEARRLGLDLIITDHHEPKAELPQARALVHPRLPGTHYPFGGLSGSGVAFKLAWALCKLASGGPKVTPQFREFLLDAVVLAALGTVADVVPVHDENRILVRFGLARLRDRPSAGLRALLKSARLDGRPRLDAADIAFRLGPRLNAAGRLGTAKVAIELLTTTSAARAEELAAYLEQQNETRQNLERHMLREARDMAEQSNGDAALVLANPTWHPGLIGIVASRLVDIYHRPALLIALPEGRDFGQGSGRSVAGFPLHEALRECSHSLLSHGGHAAAAGFRIAPDAIATFRQQFCEVASRCLGTEPSVPYLTIDAEVPLAALTPGLVQALGQLEPYGAGNPAPLLLAGGLQIVGQPAKMGNERHLSFRVLQHGKDFRAVAFGMADRLDELMSAQGQCCLVFKPRIDDWNGFRRVELEVLDFQPAPVARLI
jgi:single-stranded-DNA-specific exonuclease